MHKEIIKLIILSVNFILLLLIMNWFMGTKLSVEDMLVFLLPYFISWWVINAISLVKRRKLFHAYWIANIRRDEAKEEGNFPYAGSFLLICVIIFILQYIRVIPGLS